MNEMPGIETTPEAFDLPGCELHVNLSTRVVHEAPMSDVAQQVREEAQLAANRARGEALRREMALARLQQAAHGPERPLTTKDLSDVLEALEGL